MSCSVKAASGYCGLTWWQGSVPSFAGRQPRPRPLPSGVSCAVRSPCERECRQGRPAVLCETDAVRWFVSVACSRLVRIGAPGGRWCSTAAHGPLSICKGQLAYRSLHFQGKYPFLKWSKVHVVYSDPFWSLQFGSIQYVPDVEPPPRTFLVPKKEI